jgi:hypothetical protein
VGIVTESVAALVGVKMSTTRTVRPLTSVMYVYGVGPLGVPVVAVGAPTGPCLPSPPPRSVASRVVGPGPAAVRVVLQGS